MVPSRKASMAATRAFCDLLPWMGIARTPCFSSHATTLLAPCLVRVNTSTLVQAGSLSRCMSSSGLYALLSMYSDCSMVSTVDDTGATCAHQAQKPQHDVSELVSHEHSVRQV